MRGEGPFGAVLQCLLFTTECSRCLLPTYSGDMDSLWTQVQGECLESTTGGGLSSVPHKLSALPLKHLCKQHK